MKKVIILLLLLLNIKVVDALEYVPINTYYENNGLYAYLEYNEELSDYCVANTCNIFIEYNWKAEDDITWQMSERILVANEDMRNLIITPDNQYYLINNLDYSNLLVRARYVVTNTKDDFSPWTEEEKIIELSVDKEIFPEIKDLTIEKESNTINYNINNEDAINSYFKHYMDVTEEKIVFSSMYRINDSEWLEKIDLTTLNIEDIKLEVRVKYNIGEYESNWSNILIFEQHPEKATCLFNSDICCTTFLNISICLWILCLFVLVTILLISIENIKRKKREA